MGPAGTAGCKPSRATVGIKLPSWDARECGLFCVWLMFNGTVAFVPFATCIYHRLARVAAFRW